MRIGPAMIVCSKFEENGLYLSISSRRFVGGLALMSRSRRRGLHDCPMYTFCVGKHVRR